MRWIVATSLRFRYLVAGLAIALLYFAVTLAGSQKLDAFPEFAPVSVEVQTNCLGLSPAQIEALTTVPLDGGILSDSASLAVDIAAIYPGSKPPWYFAENNLDSFTHTFTPYLTCGGT